MKLTSYFADELENAVVRDDFSLRHVMETMSRAGLRFVPVVDEAGRMIGGVADGDMRRYIAAGGKLDDPVRLAANPKPITLDQPLPPTEIRHLMMRRGVESLPELHDGILAALHVLQVASPPAEMTAVLMAGGLGSRLAPLTDNCPKPLLELGNKPILTHIIENLRDQGVRRFVLSVNYLAEMVVNHYGNGDELDVFIDYVHETKRMGTGGALSLIDPQALSDNFLVFNGDILNDVNIAELASAHEAGGWQATMVVREHSYTVPYGVVRRGDEGDFQGADEKPTMRYCINAGIYMLSKAVLNAVPRDVFYDLPTLFSDLPRHGLRGGTYTHPGRWIDIGNVTDFNRARSIFEEQ